ncbi:hypothetical protein [uncultured Actinomyces sp.]|uniref:hypothetical protein n=1 Tax=uncultured Actinomyces sp. TaxID=249061 RepID=UPI0028E2CAF1|nr:hypothetical protein [uncultured Actinomyces sp.]
MVRADDEQQSESTAPQIAAGNPPPTAATDSSPRLTPMPPWLMHWWTPLLLAGILLAAGSFLASIWRMPLRPVSWWTINPYCPPSWPFNYHWPSKDAMALCATIAGAGFAFSAWQQRSHDNAVNAKQAEATAEREDYWKRRQHIFQLLGSENPSLRLGAIALLAELADSAAHSTLLNETEIQQLQRHIIDTLCLQARHEGLNQEHEGSQDEHAEIQRAILDAIQMRINCNETRMALTANWSTNQINLTDTRFLTSIIIENITTHSTINLSNSNMLQLLQIKNSKLKQLIWTDATFHNGVKIGDKNKPVTMEIDKMPQNSTETTFQNTTLVTRKQTLTITTNYDVKDDTPYPSTKFIECTFLNKHCPCPSECDCHTSNIENQCKCQQAIRCTCSRNCTESNVELIDHIPPLTPIRGALYIINNCHLNTLRINLNNIEVSIRLEGNRIRNGLRMQFYNTRRADAQQRYPYIYHAEPLTAHPNVRIQENIFRVDENSSPISISYKIGSTLSVPYIPIRFKMNYITKADTFEESHDKATLTREHLHILHCEHNHPNISKFHFRDAFSEEPKSHWIAPWTTGDSTSAP